MNNYPSFPVGATLRFKRWTDFDGFALEVSDFFTITAIPRNQGYYGCSFVGKDNIEHRFELPFANEDEVELVSRDGRKEENAEIRLLVNLLYQICDECDVSATANPDMDEYDDMSVKDVLKIVEAKYNI